MIQAVVNMMNDLKDVMEDVVEIWEAFRFRSSFLIALVVSVVFSKHAFFSSFSPPSSSADLTSMSSAGMPLPGAGTRGRQAREHTTKYMMLR